MLAWSRRVRMVFVRADQRPRCMVAEAVNSKTADAAKTAEPVRVALVGDRTTSTAPAASASGAVAACSHPRSLGFASTRASWTCPRMSATCSAARSATWPAAWLAAWAATWVAAWPPVRPGFAVVITVVYPRFRRYNPRGSELFRRPENDPFRATTSVAHPPTGMKRCIRVMRARGGTPSSDSTDAGDDCSLRASPGPEKPSTNSATELTPTLRMLSWDGPEGQADRSLNPSG